ncbi:MAG: hypothetical protein JWL77_823 [Chthonomonadaceae bacterium]|nr:hypothetical protein [Chthonomonadaceae bacterium]
MLTDFPHTWLIFCDFYTTCVSFNPNPYLSAQLLIRFHALWISLADIEDEFIIAHLNFNFNYSFARLLRIGRIRHFAATCCKMP